MAVAETPRIAWIGDWAVGKALAVGMLRRRLRVRVRMRAAFIRHVEALGEAGGHAMGGRMRVIALRRGLRRHEGLLRGHDGEVGHAAAGRRWAEFEREYATQGDVMRCCCCCCCDSAILLGGVCAWEKKVGASGLMARQTTRRV